MFTPVATAAPALPGSPTTTWVWTLRPALSACVRACIVHDARVLPGAPSLSYFPASPLCGLTWWFSGPPHWLGRGAALDGPLPEGPGLPAPASVVVGGPHTEPSVYRHAGQPQCLMLLFMADALHALIGLNLVEHTDRVVDAAQVLPPDWLAWCQQVLALPDMAARVRCIDEFLAPRWAACRPGPSPHGSRYADWVQHLGQRAALSTPGRSLRQLERRIKQWAGLPLRELRGHGRTEQAFFDVISTHLAGDKVNWTEVAADAGYTDQSHLCRVTRRLTGLSPEALRQRVATDPAFWVYRAWW